jgi:hypothetical protein
MTSVANLPLVGAALPLAHLPALKDWLIEGQRDLEIQDFFWAEVLEGDWRPTAHAILKELDGPSGTCRSHPRILTSRRWSGSGECRAWMSAPISRRRKW